MIDIENKVFTAVKNKVISTHTTCLVSGLPIREEATFPAVSIMEMSNRVYTKARSLSTIENMVELMYEVNIYSNKQNGRKTEAKSILALVDEAMESLGFERSYSNVISNLQNATIYRLVARYKKLESEE